MACFSPLQGFRFRNGGRLSFDNREFHPNRETAIELFGIKVGCGQCIGCRLDRSRQWAVRCMHEASQHRDNCFLTLTYSPEFLPPYGTLVLKDFQRFMKRFRKRLSLEGKQIRFMHCGEYGANLGRPHYHALIFGYDFPDKVVYRRSKTATLYTSAMLEKLWGKGFCTVGALTFDSAAYVARYIIKKVNGQAAKAHYERIDEDTGEIINLKPEYLTMSRRPGLGSSWIVKYHSSTYPSDFLIHNAKKLKPPRFYDNFYEHLDFDAMQVIKAERVEKMKGNLHDYTPERLEVRKTCLKARFRVYCGRPLEEDLT